MYMPDTCPNTYQIHSYILNQVQEYQAEENHSMKQVLIIQLEIAKLNNIMESNGMLSVSTDHIYCKNNTIFYKRFSRYSDILR